MRAVILAAAKPNIRRGFPDDSKPKALYKYRDEVFLSRQIRLLKQTGFSDINVSVAWKRQLIEDFIDENDLNVQIIVQDNPKDTYKSISTIFSAIQDDVLLVYGDVWFGDEHLERIKELKDEPILTIMGVESKGRHMHYIKSSKFDEILEKMLLPRYRDPKGTLIPFAKLLSREGINIKMENIEDFDRFSQRNQKK